MDDFRYLTPEEREILQAEPAITAEELDAINELFAHYIIYTRERDGLRLSTSCCHRREELLPYIRRTETPEERDVLRAKHGDYLHCPFCGKYATLRAKGQTRGAKWESLDGRAVLLRAMPDGTLYARAVWLRLDIRDLPWEPPKAAVASIYHFSPGQALQFWQGWGREWHSDREQKALHREKRVAEPFRTGGLYQATLGYAAIGLEEIEKSFLRWTDYTLWRKQDAPREELYDDLIRFLTVGSLYPRQLEMLNKARQRTLINDLMWEGKKNARIFRWEETDPRRAFGLSGQELRAYLDLGDALGVLRVKRELGCSLAEAMEWFNAREGFDSEWEFGRFLKLCRKYGTEPGKTKKYLLRFTGPRHNGGWFGLRSAMLHWEDYLTNAKEAGLDTGLPNVLMPRDLFGAHDNAAALVQARKEAARREETERQNAAAAERRAVLDRLYGFETEHYFIRAPRDASEIIAEGNSLRHCVGGYAARHSTGQVTILLLRSKDHPETPLCTIEVDRFRLVQIHGYANEREPGSVKPELRFAEIYEPWKRWLDAKCPRNKNGTPRVPKKNQKEKTA